MVNIAFQKSLRSKDKDKFVASLRYGGILKAATGIGLEEIVVKGTKEDPFSYGNSLFSPSGIFGRGSGAIHPESPDSTFSPDTRGSAMMEDDEGYDEAYNYSQEAKENEEFNKKYDEYVISKNQSLEGKYSVANYVNTDIINKTVKETDVSKTDAYSILFGESSGGQFSHSSGIAKGGLQLTLNGFIGGKQHTKEYSYTPDRNTEKAKYDAFIENAKDDFSQLSDDDALYYSIQYMDKIKKDFPNKYGRDATLKDIAIIYTKGPGGATKFINDYSLLNKAENSLLNTYVNNVLETAENIEGVPELQEGGTPWGGATGTIYKEPSGPKPLQQQMINAFSEGGVIKDIALGSLIPGYGAMKAFAKVGDSLNKDSDTYSGPSMSYDTSVALDRLGRGIDTSHPEAPRYSTFSPDVHESKMMEDDEGYDEAYNYTQEMRDIQNNLSDLDIENNDKELLKNYINNVFFKSNEISYEGDTKESSDRKKLFYPTIPPRQAYPEGTGEKEQKSLIEYYVLPEDLENIIKNVKELSIASPNAKKLFDKKIIEHRYTTDRSPFHIDGPGEQTATYKTIRFSLNDIIKDIEEKGTERNKETGLYNSNGLNILAALAEFKKQEEAGNILPRDNPIRIISEKDIFI